MCPNPEKKRGNTPSRATHKIPNNTNKISSQGNIGPINSGKIQRKSQILV